MRLGIVIFIIAILVIGMGTYIGLTNNQSEGDLDKEGVRFTIEPCGTIFDSDGKSITKCITNG